MPLYEYRCSKCGNVFEVIQKFADAPLTEHPECGGAVERLLSTSALQFKGSGWYVNDYAKKSSPSHDKGEGKSESKSEGKSDGKSEGKSDGKSEGRSEGKSDSKSGDSGSKSESKPAASTKSNE